MSVRVLNTTRMLDAGTTKSFKTVLSGILKVKSWRSITAANCMTMAGPC